MIKRILKELSRTATYTKLEQYITNIFKKEKDSPIAKSWRCRKCKNRLYGNTIQCTYCDFPQVFRMAYLQSKKK